MNFFFSPDRIFKMVANIQSGIIFSLLPINVVFMGTSLYTLENVSNTRNISNLLLHSHKYGCFLVKFFAGTFHNGHDLYTLFIGVAVVLLLFC